MGMYDNITIDVDKLPVSEQEKEHIRRYGPNWQTKDFNRDLSEYIIKKSGKLFVKEFDSETKTRVKYSTTITFYSNIGSWKDDYDWYEFVATFHNGKLEEITGGKRE